MSFLHLALGEFGLLELCSLTLFKFRINVLLTKKKPNSPSSWAIDPYSGRQQIPGDLGGGGSLAMWAATDTYPSHGCW
jgi:hypothetical protein